VNWVEVAGFREHGDEPWGSIKGGEFDYLSCVQLVKKYSTS
jgi:hypothetical protein